MGPLVIFNRHILILRGDNLSLLAGKRAIRQGFKRGTKRYGPYVSPSLPRLNGASSSWFKRARRHPSAGNHPGVAEAVAETDPHPDGLSYRPSLSGI